MKGKNGISSTMKNLKSAIVVVTDNERYSVALAGVSIVIVKLQSGYEGSSNEFRYINDSETKLY